MRKIFNTMRTKNEPFGLQSRYACHSITPKTFGLGA
jgi:hypothetical protein